MSKKLLFTAILLLGVFFGFSQPKLPVKFRVEKKATSKPFTELEEMFFKKYYYTKPVTIDLSKSSVSIVFDDGRKSFSKSIVEVAHKEEVYDGELEYETLYFVDKDNTSDTLTFVVDHEVGYYQLTYPEKNKEGESVGYVSYIHFLDDNGLVSK